MANTGISALQQGYRGSYGGSRPGVGMLNYNGVDPRPTLDFSRQSAVVYDDSKTRMQDVVNAFGLTPNPNGMFGLTAEGYIERDYIESLYNGQILQLPSREFQAAGLINGYLDQFTTFVAPLMVVDNHNKKFTVTYQTTHLAPFAQAAVNTRARFNTRSYHQVQMGMDLVQLGAFESLRMLLNSENGPAVRRMNISMLSQSHSMTTAQYTLASALRLALGYDSTAIKEDMPAFAQQRTPSKLRTDPITKVYRAADEVFAAVRPSKMHGLLAIQNAARRLRHDTDGVTVIMFGPGAAAFISDRLSALDATSLRSQIEYISESGRDVAKDFVAAKPLYSGVFSVSGIDKAIALEQPYAIAFEHQGALDMMQDHLCIGQYLAVRTYDDAAYPTSRRGIDDGASVDPRDAPVLYDFKTDRMKKISLAAALRNSGVFNTGASKLDSIGQSAYSAAFAGHVAKLVSTPMPPYYTRGTPEYNSLSQAIRSQSLTRFDNHSRTSHPFIRWQSDDANKEFPGKPGKWVPAQLVAHISPEHLPPAWLTHIGSIATKQIAAQCNLTVAALDSAIYGLRTAGLADPEDWDKISALALDDDTPAAIKQHVRVVGQFLAALQRLFGSTVIQDSLVQGLTFAVLITGRGAPGNSTNGVWQGNQAWRSAASYSLPPALAFSAIVDELPRTINALANQQPVLGDAYNKPLQYDLPCAQRHAQISAATRSSPSAAITTILYALRKLDIDFMENCLSMGIPLPCDILLARPSLQFETQSVMVCKQGFARTVLSNAYITSEIQAIADTVYFQVNVGRGFIGVLPGGATLLRHWRPKQYLCGGSTEFVDLGSPDSVNAFRLHVTFEADERQTGAPSLMAFLVSLTEPLQDICIQFGTSVVDHKAVLPHRFEGPNVLTSQQARPFSNGPWIDHVAKELTALARNRYMSIGNVYSTEMKGADMFSFPVAPLLYRAATYNPSTDTHIDGTGPCGSYMFQSPGALAVLNGASSLVESSLVRTINVK